MQLKKADLTIANLSDYKPTLKAQGFLDVGEWNGAY